MSRYGAPQPPNPWPTVIVGHPLDLPRGEHEEYVDASIVRQRRQLNALAYVAEDVDR